MSPEDAHELYDIVIRGTDKTHPAGKFSTMTMGGFCSVNLSDFLRRFAGKTMIVPKSYFCPHNLTRVLTLNHPNVCWYFAATNKSCMSLLESLRPVPNTLTF